MALPQLPDEIWAIIVDFLRLKPLKAELKLSYKFEGDEEDEHIVVERVQFVCQGPHKVLFNAGSALTPRWNTVYYCVATFPVLPLSLVVHGSRLMEQNENDDSERSFRN